MMVSSMIYNMIYHVSNNVMFPEPPEEVHLSTISDDPLGPALESMHPI